jgi:hypothetical protein
MIRRQYPLVPLFTRSRDKKHAIALKIALKTTGASLVIPETLKTGQQLAAFVLQPLGMAEGATAYVVDA